VCERFVGIEGDEKMMKWNRGVLALGLVLGACGGSDGDGGGGGARGGQSYADIADAIAAPTGTVDATSAPEIAAEFEKISSASGGAKSRPKQAVNQMQACPAGGSINTTAQGNNESAQALIEYDNCCYEATCCMNGGGTWYFSTSASTEYSYCANYKVDMDCGSDLVASVQYEGCVSPTGWVYVVRVEGKTFAVTGHYSDGNGTLNVTGVNGSFTCTYTNHSGSCSGSDGEFSF
jgi:hypothetical protein